MSEVTSAKAVLRREMRALRRGLADPAERSGRIWAHVAALDVVVGAGTIMVFESIPGEPITAPFIERCRSARQVVLLPEDVPTPNPAEVDVVIVPGLAFTRGGDRLGQGGGWYDRFLSRTRPDCATIGVCFEPQLLDSIPSEAHDVSLDYIVTDVGLAADQRVRRS